MVLLGGNICLVNYTYFLQSVCLMQAYTVELEEEVSQLKEENKRLREQQEALRKVVSAMVNTPV